MTASQLHAYCNRTIPPFARMNVMLHGPAQVAWDLGMKVIPHLHCQTAYFNHRFLMSWT